MRLPKIITTTITSLLLHANGYTPPGTTGITMIIMMAGAEDTAHRPILLPDREVLLRDQVFPGQGVEIKPLLLIITD